MAFEYIVNGKLIKLPVNPNKIAVRFEDSLDTIERSSVIDEKPEVGSFENRLEVPNETITIIDVPPTDQLGTIGVATAANALNADPAVEQAMPVFDLGDKQAVATDRIIVGFKPETEDKALDIITGIEGEVIDSKWNEYTIRLKPNVNPFDVIAEITKRAEVDFAEPDFVTIGEHTPIRSSAESGNGNSTNGNSSNDDSNSNPILNAPDESEIVASHVPSNIVSEVENTTNFKGFMTLGIGTAAVVTDPLLQFQYAARITQADRAWGLVTPSSSIKIAILDEGVDVNHPDLKSSIPTVRGTYDAIDQDYNQQPNDWDGHGTACAGLAAAIPNNSIGIRGIAGGCSLMGIKIAYSPSNGANWVTTNSQISDGIDWAWQNGADILSNSWGGGPPSNAVINAFERARVQGRNGKGCVIVIAAGNAAGPVNFPATLPNVVSVAASNEFDQPKTKTSADGENWWGSCFGPEVDLAAPGVHNYTTDISGTAGYN